MKRTIIAILILALVIWGVATFGRRGADAERSQPVTAPSDQAF